MAGIAPAPLSSMIRLFSVFIPASVLGLLISEAMLAAGSYLLAYLLGETGNLEMYYLYEGGLERLGVVVGSLLLAAYFNDLYDDLRVISRLRLVQQFCLVLGITFLMQALVAYVNPWLMMERWPMLAGSGIALVALPAWRILYDRLVTRYLHRQKVLFVGANKLVQALTGTLQAKPQFGMLSMGYLAAEAVEEEVAGLGAHLGPVSAVKETAAAQRPDMIVVGLSERRGQLPVLDLLELRLSGVRVKEVADIYETVMWRVSVSTLRPSHLLFSGELGPSPRTLALKRLGSYVVAGVGIVLSAPLMLLAYALVKLTSPGPAIYRQRRVGLNGRVFEVLKFRSMYVDAEARTGAVWAQKNDPRITPVGRWLRTLRLDELPQFFNVLKGEMAIVGPRPERPEFVRVLSEQIPFYGQRHAVPPGITGWAQINHHYGESVEDTIEKLEYDLYYLKNLSFSLDLYIIFNTVKVMLLGRGAQ